MYIRSILDCEEKIVVDNTNLRELINPSILGLKIRYSLARARIKPGETSYKHRLKSSEVYLILEGKGKMHIDDEVEEVSPGNIIYIPPNSIQYIENIGGQDLIFLCIVDPAWKQAEDELVE